MSTNPWATAFCESAPFGVGLVVLDGWNGGYPSAPARKEHRPVGLVKLADDAARIDLQIGQGYDTPGILFVGLQGTS